MGAGDAAAVKEVNLYVNYKNHGYAKYGSVPDLV